MTTARTTSSALALVLLTAGAGLAGEQEPAFVYQTTHDAGTNSSGYALFSSGRDIAVDGQGNAFVLAYVYDVQGNPRHNDLRVVKLDAAGAVVWERSLAGSGLESYGGIAVDPAGDVYVAGRTLSSDFPVVDAMQPTPAGGADMFITKLAGEDGSLVYSTYFGGERDERCNDIAVNAAGEVYFIGATISRTIPLANPLQDELADYNGLLYDVYVGRLSADGQTLLYGTYLGGNDDDFGDAIGIDAAGNIYVAGRTESPDFPTAVAVQPALAGERDLFVARISADGTMLDYSTFLGGEDRELLGDMIVDAAGNVYLAGDTRSVTFPTTPGVLQPAFAGGVLACGQPPFEPRFNCDDMFVVRMTADGGLGFATYLGGSLIDEATDVAVGSDGAVYTIGSTTSADFPLTEGQGNVVVSKLAADGSGVIYTAEVFSASPNQGHGVAVGPDGDVFITGAVHAPADLYIARLHEQGPAADLNGDGVVDLTDLSILLASFGADAGGDIDGDGATTLADLALLLVSLS